MGNPTHPSEVMLVYNTLLGFVNNFICGPEGD